MTNDHIHLNPTLELLQALRSHRSDSRAGEMRKVERFGGKGGFYKSIVRRGVRSRVRGVAIVLRRRYYFAYSTTHNSLILYKDNES